MSRTPRMAAVFLAAALALAGCASVPSDVPAAEPDAADPGTAAPGPTAGDAVQLVDLWRVTDAAGAGDEAFLRLDGAELIAWTDCGIAMGSWRASGGLFLADVTRTMAEGECATSVPGAGAPAESLDWLYAAEGYRITDSGAELLGADGAVVAVLAVDGAPPANPSHSDAFLVAPEVTPEMEAALADPAALAPGVDPVGRDALLGRWGPGESDLPVDADPPFLEFADDGTWRASDGCNGVSGRWVQGADGLLLATSGVSTSIGCENWAGATWLWATARIGLVDGALVFYETDGTMLGTAVRS